MADQLEIRTRARIMASAAGLGGKHLADSNRDLQALQHTYSVWEFNALLAAIRKQNEEDRLYNDRLPILIFASCNGGLVPDSIVPIYDDNPPWSPIADSFPIKNSTACSDNYQIEQNSPPERNRFTLDPLETQQLPRLSRTRNSENFATEACLSAAYMQPSRHSTPTASHFIIGPD